jgi:hypothetical protein
MSIFGLYTCSNTVFGSSHFSLSTVILAVAYEIERNRSVGRGTTLRNRVIRLITCSLSAEMSSVKYTAISFSIPAIRIDDTAYVANQLKNVELAISLSQIISFLFEQSYI